MNTVMRRRVENVFERAEPLHEFCMDPKLVDQIESVHQGEHPRRKSQKHDRCIEHPVRDAAKPALTARDAEVKVLARVMDHVKIPKEARLVTDAMEPVVDKVVNKEKYHPRPPRIGRKLVRSDVVSRHVNQSGHKSEYNAKADTAKTEN